VLILDDYGHHPTAIRVTIEGIKKFWPQRRLVVDFMSHTYTRTIALQDEFVTSLDEADAVVMHKIYASARERPIPEFDGKTLFHKLCARRADLIPIDLGLVSGKGMASDQELTRRPATPGPNSSSKGGFALYSKEPLDAQNSLLDLLRPGDIFLTMGAGDNWKLGKAIADKLREGRTSQTSEKIQEQP
jgi:UDP-N-acetylmuramate--alanine ligase